VDQHRNPVRINTLSEANKFVHEWSLWERGRSQGFDEAITIIANHLCGGAVTAEQREVGVELYDLLLDARRRFRA
jgi:hypothetical protein